MERTEILNMVNKVLEKRGRPSVADDATPARDVGFRSLDFSEVALRLEMQLGKEFTFDAASMRRIETIKDVIDFFEHITKA
jgi:acyl carrier protein